MSGVESSGVTLSLVDSSILSCWEEMIKQGKECSLMLKHSKGNVTVKLQSTSKVSPLHQASLSASAEAKKGKKKSKKKRLERLLAYHQRLVEERGLPPSRLMLQQAAEVLTSQPSQSHGQTEKQFKCDQCKFSSELQRGFKVHMGRIFSCLKIFVMTNVKNFWQYLLLRKSEKSCQRCLHPPLSVTASLSVASSVCVVVKDVKVKKH